MIDGEKSARQIFRRGRGNLFLRIGVYGLFLLLCVVAVDGVLYLRWRRATAQPLPQRPFEKAVPHVSPETLRRLGWIEANRASSFVHFPKRKKAGVIRIGCIGDSFTFGTEVGPDEDYPTLLQGLFRTRGYPNVEVLNFSSGWYGFQQAYILWDEVARGFGLDYIVLGPMTFFTGRDTTFDHSSPTTIHFHHARRVLSGAGLRLLDVVGDTFAGRASAYRSFIPYWRYLRYDRRPPAFLACLLPKGREMLNPFYYRPDPQKEALVIYERLLRSMADSGTQILLGHYMPEIVEVGRRVGRQNLFATSLQTVHRFPYRALKNHNGPAGNRILAEQVFAVLTGRRGVRFPLVRFDPLGPSAGRPGRLPWSDLGSYDRVRIDFDGGRPWRFVEIMPGTRVRYVPDEYFRSRGFTGLLALKLPEHRLPGAIFLPVAEPLEDGMALSVTPHRGPRAGQTVLLGRVSLVRPDFNLGVVDLTGVFQNEYPGFNDETAVVKVEASFRDAFPGYVMVGGRKILSATAVDASGRATLSAMARHFLQIYPPPAVLGDGAGRARGRLSLRLESSAGHSSQVPFSRWRRTDRDFRADFSESSGLEPIRRPQ